MKTITNQNIRLQNQKNILKYILDKKVTSRQEISHDLHMSMPTLIQNLNILYEMGIIQDSGYLASTGGRKAIVITPVADYKLSLGLSIATDSLEIAVLNLLGEVKSGVKVPLVFENTSQYYEDLNKIVMDFIRDKNHYHEKMIGVGIAIPALISPDQTTILESHALHLNNISYKKILSGFPWPCKLINHAAAAALADISQMEDTTGNIVYLNLSSDVGGAIYINGHLYTGDHGAGGELGHMCIVPDGKPCHCGKRGCLNAYCSSKLLSSFDPNGLLQTFFQLLEQKDPAALSVWDEYMDHLTFALINIHTFFDCDIILGGFVGRWLDPYIEQIISRIAREDPFYKQIPYVRSCLVGRWSSAIGAAILPMKDYIDSI